MSSVTNSRTTPLSAPPPERSGASPSDVAHVPHPSDDERAQVERQRRFAEGLRALRVGEGSLRLGERALMVAGGIIAPLGVIVVLLGWWGAAQTPYVFEQVPYLISGGVFGLALVFLGAFFYFAHWLTELVKEHRAQSTAILEALGRLQDEVGRLGHVQGNGHVVVDARRDRDGDGQLVATQHGTMAHAADCVVVAGKVDLRTVTEADGLERCKLCQPS